MGGEGFAVAILVLLLLLYFLPALFQRREVFNETIIDERFSENLRMVIPQVNTAQVFRQRHELERGKIFKMERKVNTMQTEEANVKLEQDIRLIARTRAKARARITRRALRSQQLKVVAALCALSALGLWALMLKVAISWWIPAICTVVAAAGSFATFQLNYRWQLENQADKARIEKADRVLQNLRAEHTELVAQAEHETAKPLVVPNDFAPALEVESVSATANQVAGMQDARGLVSSVEDMTTGEKSEKRAQTPVTYSASETTVVNTATTSRPLSATYRTQPSYTLTPQLQRRRVAPYVAPAAPSVNVPYRPKAVGERLGDAVLDSANQAPAMTGKEELRTNVMGSGFTLDVLLERRRA